MTATQNDAPAQVGATLRNALFRTPARQAAVLAGATGISQILLACMFVIAARLSSPAEFGLLGTAYAISLVGASIVDFGTNALWTRELVAERMIGDELRARAGGKLVVCLFAAGVVVVVVHLIAPGSVLVTAGPLLVGTALAQTAQVPLRARLRSDLVGAVTVADRLLALAVFGGLLLVPGVDAVVALAVALCCGLALDGAVALRLDGILRTARRPRNPYNGARHFGLMALAVNAQSLDIVAISALGGPVQAGLYAAVNRWTSAMGLLVTAFTSATTPFVARSGSLRQAFPQLRAALWMPCGAVMCCIVMAVTAPWVVGLLLGAEYEGSAAVLQILALGIIPAVAAQPLATYLQALGHDRVVATTLTVVVIVQLLGVAAASAWGSVVDVAVVMALGQLAMASTLAVVAVRIWRVAAPLQA